PRAGSELTDAIPSPAVETYASRERTNATTYTYTNGDGDEALMARAQSGDADAFADLYDRHGERAMRVAGAICQEAGGAEDAVRLSFLAIWRDRARFGPEHGSFKAWSMGIVSIRAAGPKVTVEQVIALAYFGELSHTEIASQLDLPAGSVKGRMRLGLEKMRKQMGALR
ncbi:MAG TPA: sigma factor, partial [Solirubrobacterales bacterium]|nr:sigma factor [Solirubrobacterales bacterium]